MQWVKLSEVKANPNNPRVIRDEDFAKLKRSIIDFPEMLEKRPLVCYTEGDKYIVLGGNMRLKALSDIGAKEIPIILADEWTEEQRAQFLIKDNVGFGEWDWNALANEWDAEQLEAWGLDLPPMDAIELEAEEDNYEMPDELQTDIVLGDLFEIGEHRLLCGSSIEIDTWQKLMNEELCDLVVTDPPYNVALGMETKEQAKARNRRTDGLIIQNDKMSKDDFYKFLYDFFTSIGSYSKKGASIYVWYASSEVVNFVSSLVDSGWMYKQELIWNKNAMIMGRQDYQWKHEPCLYGWKEGASHNWNSDRKQTTILEFNKPSRNGEHPTMKPVELIAYQVKNSSKIGELVCDGFLGSGTTMVASHQLKRKCYGMELDPKYCQVIIDRMRKLDPTLVVKRNGQII
jgi:site-specific DNA-methyltransferase (adenine-specific)